MKILLLAAVAATVGAGAQAATVFGDEVDVFVRSNSFFVDTTETTVFDAAGSSQFFEPSSAVFFEIQFVDDDSFFVVAGNNPANQDIFTVEMSGLDFTEGGVAAPITSFAFDAAATDILEFNAGGDFSIEETSFTDTSVALTYRVGSSELIGDQPQIFFNIGFGEDGGGGGGGGGNGGGPAPVPLPAGALLLVTGLAALGAARGSTRKTA